MLKSIYLAGKVRAGCWRHTIVKGLREAFTGGEYDAESIMPVNKPWPVMQGAVLGWDYTGPYFISCDHECYHGPRTHGLGPAPEHGACPELPREDVVRLCFDAIQRSDIVFAWIEDKTAYGTLAELGYAKAKGKTVWIAGPEVTSEYVYDMRSELWFTFTMADKRLPYREYPTPLAALTHLIPPQFDSPIEEKFWQVWMSMGNPFKLAPQYPIGRYRVDFAYPPARIAIELDGHATHSSPDAIAYDRKRQREIESAGWKVVRFGGKEVYADAPTCVEEALTLLQRELLKQRVDTGLARIDRLQEKTTPPLKQEDTPQSDIPVLTIEQVEEYWPSIKRRCRDKKGGAKIAALLNGCTIVSVEGTSVLPVIVLRAKGAFVYNCLAQNTSQYASLEWAVKTELGRECKVRLLEPTSILPSLPNWEDVPLLDEGEEGRLT